MSFLPRAGLFAESSSSFRKPNVLFLFSDQHNATVTGFGGHPDVQTPFLNALAGEGVRFDRTYCQDGVCAPSRNSIITGHYPRTFGTLDNSHPDTLDLHASILPRLVPLQKAFGQAGYYTFTAGKRHLLPLLDRNWDYSAGHLKGGQWPSEAHDTLNYWTWIAQQNLTSQAEADFSTAGRKARKNGTETRFGCGISALPPEATMEAFTARQTIAFLESPQAKKQPFFAWSTFYRPHQPYTPQKKYADPINYAALTLPRSLHQDPNDLPPGLKAARTRKDEGWDIGEATDDDYRRYIGYYIALVQEIDDHIGAILKTLDEQGLAENTIVIYSSDHGDFVGNHGLPEKQATLHNFYEDTLRVSPRHSLAGENSRGRGAPRPGGNDRPLPHVAGLMRSDSASLFGMPVTILLRRQRPGVALVPFQQGAGKLSALSRVDGDLEGRLLRSDAGNRARGAEFLALFLLLGNGVLELGDGDGGEFLRFARLIFRDTDVGELWIAVVAIDRNRPDSLGAFILRRLLEHFPKHPLGPNLHLGGVVHRLNRGLDALGVDAGARQESRSGWLRGDDLNLDALLSSVAIHGLGLDPANLKAVVIR